MFLEPQQRFTFRIESKTVATGVVVKCMDPPPIEVSDKKLRKKLIKAEMEKLGFNPYHEYLETRLKPEYKVKRDMPMYHEPEKQG